MSYNNTLPEEEIYSDIEEEEKDKITPSYNNNNHLEHEVDRVSMLLVEYCTSNYLGIFNKSNISTIMLHNIP